MPRLNIEEDFPAKILAVLQAGGGDPDRVAGNALRFLTLCQERYKHGLIITEAEYISFGFIPQLVGVFAARLDGGGYQAIGAGSMFGWLRKRVLAGQKGGLKKGPTKARKPPPSRTKTVKSASCDSNNLGASKRKQAQASSSSSSSCSVVVVPRSKQKKLTSRGSSGSKNNNKNWLQEIWNENCGALPKVDELAPDQVARIAALKCKDPDKWTAAVKTLAASKACNGKGQGTPFFANFNFLLKPGTREKAAQGTYGRLNAPLIESSAASNWGKGAPELPKDEQDRLKGKLGDLIASLRNPAAKSNHKQKE